MRRSLSVLRLRPEAAQPTGICQDSWYKPMNPTYMQLTDIIPISAERPFKLLETTYEGDSRIVLSTRTALALHPQHVLQLLTVSRGVRPFTQYISYSLTAWVGLYERGTAL